MRSGRSATRSRRTSRPPRLPAEAGDFWTWTAMSDTNCSCLGWSVHATRMPHTRSLATWPPLANRVQLTSDGQSLSGGGRRCFAADIDYAMLMKHYGEPVGAGPLQPWGMHRHRATPRRRPSRPEARQHQLCRAAEPHDAHGHASVHAADERFQKKAEDHAHSVAIYTMHYNFVRIHQTLRCTPAMAAGVTKKLWEPETYVPERST